MSFISSEQKGRSLEAGYFLESEVGLVRKTRQIKAASGQSLNGRKIVPAGTLYSEGEEKGIVYEEVDVTSGDMPGSVVLAGRVYKDRLPEATQSGLADAAGFTLIGGSPAVIRPTSAPVISLTTTLKTGGTEGNVVVKADKVFAEDLGKDDFTVNVGDTTAVYSTAAYTDEHTATLSFTASSAAAGSISVTAKAGAFKEALKDSNTAAVSVAAGG